MKKILFLMSLLILVSSCQKEVQVKYVEKPVYIECKKPNIPEKPEFKQYNAIRVNYEGNYYYCVDKPNANILISNWILYKQWCEDLYNILNKDK